MTPQPSTRPVLLATFASLFASIVPARDLLVDQRGGAPYSTLAAAATEARPGDTIILAKGSGPYRETLSITTSGIVGAPIVVEGNGETVTGFSTITFTTSGGASIYTLPNAFATNPVVISWRGRRIPQDQTTGALLGPVSIDADGRTLRLNSGTPTDGWEVSTRVNAVSITNVSHHVYRNLHATGASNDGFNLHGAGTGLVFENICARDNLDEGFSAHDTISATISRARFWGNDNGIGNVGSSLLVATDVRVHDNLGYGVFLSGSAQGTLSGVTAWNNGAAQFRFDSSTSGTCSQTSAWAATWGSPPWRRYMESATLTATSMLMGQAAAPTTGWPSVPSVAGSAAPSPVTPTSAAAVPSVASLIQSAKSAGRPLVVLPAGIHTLATDITLSNASNLEIDGSGATLVMGSASYSILRLLNANNVTVRGLTLSYDPLPYTQATITSVSAGSFGFTIQDGYPDITASFVASDGSPAPAHIFDAQGRRHPQAYDFYQPPLTITSPRTGTAAGTWPASLAVGDQVAFDRRLVDRKNAVEVLNNSGPVLFEDVTLLASPMLGFIGRYGEDVVTFRRVTIRAGNKPSGATRERLLSTNADGFNFVQCRVGPTLEQCDTSRMGDDSLNVHGYLFQVSSVPSSTSLQFTWPGGAAGFLAPYKAGDTIRLYAPSGGDRALAGTATYASHQVIGTTNNVTTYQLNFSAPASVEVGQYFDLPAVNCDGYIVRDSYFHDHRGRGLRLMASNGLVENNRFERLTKSAVSIGPELAYWGEAGWVSNVVVRNNTARDIGEGVSLAANGSYAPGAISVYVRTDALRHPYPLENDGVVITGNVVDGSSVSGIHAFAARNLTVTGNATRRTNLTRGPGVDSSTGLATTGPISLDGIIDATISANAVLVAEDMESHATNATFTTGQTLGTSGEGWAGGWRTGSANSTTNGTVLATTPVHSGKRLKTTVVTQAGQANSSGAVSRPYAAAGIATPYTVAFRYRPDSLAANLRSSLSDNRTRSSAASSTASWRIDSINGTWQVFDGPANGGINQFIDTGLPATDGVAYEFTVTSDPAALTWSVTIASPSASVSRSGLHFRATSFDTDASEIAGARWLTFAIYETIPGGATTTVGATGSGSVDDIRLRVPVADPVPTAAYIADALETHSAGATFTTGQALGAARDGWSMGWRTASANSTTTGTIATSSPLDSGHRLAASIATQSAKSYAGGALTRPYIASRVTGPFDVSFRFRPDSASSNLGYVLWDSRVRSAVPDSGATWQIASINGTWRVYDGAANGGSNAYIDTGLPVVIGSAYDFAIVVDPAARTWGVQIANGSTSVSHTGLNWRASTYATDTTEAIGGRWLGFSAQETLSGATTTGASGGFSIDTLVIHAPVH